MNKIIIYSKSYCPYCTKAKNLLTAKGLSFTEVDIENDAKLQDEVFAKSAGRRTVPQIFINDIHVGGFDDLSAKNKSGELDKMLNV